ncbi:hypothetical protein DFH08DRAFT_815478 [Mycena albidolilacea]|uniref:Uncharacterized protein n=1 Tax=Mycena albidolilacea TaxID=1033008 RepID=A0AAD6ZLZ8_9AGAR|nr:hypothetical protein DFH08DRAFT_815478 [Mycena albidolilacea]
MNLALTSLTAGRILWVRRQSSYVGLGHTFRSRYTSAIGIILESGAIYCVVAIFVLVAASQNDLEVFDIGYAIGQQMLIIRRQAMVGPFSLDSPPLFLWAQDQTPKASSGGS